MDGEKSLKNANIDQKSNDRQGRRPEGKPNQQKIAETGGAVKNDDINLKLIEQEQKRLVNKQNHKQLKEFYDSQKIRIQKIKEEIEAFDRRDEDFAYTFSKIGTYGDHLKKGGDDVSKRASTLREFVQDVLAMFHELEYNTKVNVKEIQELSERIQTEENLVRQITEYNANFSKSFEDMEINYKQRMDSARNQKSVLKETLEKICFDEKQKGEVLFQLEQDVLEMQRKLQNLIAQEKERTSAEELTLEKSKIKSHIEVTENELNSFNSESKKLSYDLVLLNSTMMEEKNKVDSLKNLLLEKDQKIEIAKTKIANLSTIAPKNDEELKSLKQILSDRETTVTKLTGEFNALKQSNSDNSSEVQKLEKMLQMNKKKLSSLLEEGKKLEDLESQQLSEIEMLKEKWEQSKQQNASIHNQLNEKKNLANVKDDQIKKLELKVRQIKSKVQAIHEENKNLREEKKASTEKDREVKKLQNEVETLQSMLSKSNQVIKEMTTEKQNLADENKQINHNVSDIDKKLQLAEKLKKELEKEANAVKEEMKELKNAIDLSQRKTSSNNPRPEKIENFSLKQSLPKVVDVKTYPNIDALLRSQILVPTTAGNEPRRKTLFERDSRDPPDDDYTIENLFSGL